MSANKLAMNNDKTKFMIVSKRKQTFKDVNIPAQPQDIKDSNTIKLLGVEITADMKFNYFLSYSKTLSLQTITVTCQCDNNSEKIVRFQHYETVY